MPKPPSPPTVRDALFDELLTTRPWTRPVPSKTLDVHNLLLDINYHLGGLTDRWVLHPSTLVEVYRCLRERAEAPEIKGLGLTACECTVEMRDESHYGARAAISWRGKTFGQGGVGTRDEIKREIMTQLTRGVQAPIEHSFAKWVDEDRAVRLFRSSFRVAGMEEIVSECVGRELARLRATTLAQQAPRVPRGRKARL